VGGRVYGIERATGNQLWRFPSGEPLQASFRHGLASAGDLLIAVADDRTVYAINRNSGEQAWTYSTSDNIVGTPVVVGDVAVMPNAKGQLIALRTSDGSLFWSQPFSPQSGVHPNISSFDRSVIFSTPRGTVVSMDVVSQRVNYTKTFTTLNAAGNFSISGNRLLVNSGSFVISHNAATGAQDWQRNVGEQIVGVPGASSESVAVVTQRGLLVVLDNRGNLVFRQGVNIGGGIVGRPIFSGGKVLVGSQNGSVTMVNPLTADIEWNYFLPNLLFGRTPPASNAPGGMGPGGPMAGGGRGGGGPMAGGGRGGGGQPGPGGVGQPGGGAAPGAGTTPPQEPFIQPSGNIIASGSSLFVQARDGSLLMFDRELGVDVTPPSARLAWPNQGETVSGRAPMEIIFRVEDFGVGVNSNNIKIEIGGKAYAGRLDRNGFLSIRISVGGVNAPLPDGRQTVKLTLTDWLGNTSESIFVLTINNQLPPLGSPPTTPANTGGMGGIGGGGMPGDR
jgi:outer membrane protein assembly factor BamB